MFSRGEPDFRRSRCRFLLIARVAVHEKFALPEGRACHHRVSAEWKNVQNSLFLNTLSSRVIYNQQESVCSETKTKPDAFRSL